MLSLNRLSIRVASQPEATLQGSPPARFRKRLWFWAGLLILVAALADFAVLAALQKLNRPPAYAVLAAHPQLSELYALAQAQPRDPEVQLGLAQLYLHYRHYLSARDAFTRALELGADRWEALQGRSRANEALLRYDLAAADREQTIALRPDHLDSYLALAELRLMQNDPAGARAALEQIPMNADNFPQVDGGKDPVGAAARLAIGYSRLDDWPRVLEITRRCRQAVPDSAAAQIMEGKALHALGRRTEALPCLEAGMRLAPDNAELRYLLGTAYLARNSKGDTEKAKDSFLQAVQRDPTHGQACYELAQLLDARGQIKEAAAAYYRAYQLGMDGVRPLLRSGELLLRAGMEEEGHYRRGLYYELTGKPEKALAAYENLIKKHSCCRSGYMHMARVYRLLRRPEKVLECVQKARQVEPNKAKDLDWSLILAYAEAGKDTERAAALKRLAASDTQDAVEASLHLASLADTAGRFEESLTWVRQCIAKDPDDPHFRRIHGKYLLQQRQNPERLRAAIAELETAARLQPDDADTLDSLGRAYSYAGRSEEALLALRHSIDLEPENGPRYQTLARLLEERGQPEEAKEMLATFSRYQDYVRVRQMLRARAKRERANPDVQRQLAEFYMKARDYAAAAATFELCLRLNPHDARARTRLAEAYGKLGRHLERQAALAGSLERLQ